MLTIKWTVSQQLKCMMFFVAILTYSSRFIAIFTVTLVDFII